MSKIVASRRSVCRAAILACLPLLLMLLAGCQRAPAAKAAAPPPEVGVTTVHVTPVQRTTALPGRTTAVTTSDVRPQISGPIKPRSTKRWHNAPRTRRNWKLLSST
jgi:multidrug efflux pump subunit AcrA (membrane-fusion protein)